MHSPTYRPILGVLLVAIGSAVVAFADDQTPPAKGHWQTPGEIQQPKGTWQKPGEIQTVREHCAERLRIGSDALFEFNKWSLTREAEKTLEALRPLLTQAGKHPISIEGYTDSIGTDLYNDDLSEKRARTVRSWLAEHGFVPADAPVKGFGRNRPIAPNRKHDGSDNPEGRAANRRVEIVIDTCK